jgi:hypothetical protein
MKRYQITGLFVLAMMAAFWAYTIMDSLMREFSEEITTVDLGAIFVLGLISGVALGVAFTLGRRSSAAG